LLRALICIAAFLTPPKLWKGRGWLNNLWRPRLIPAKYWIWTRSKPLDIDAEIYKWRHLIENFFCKLKEFKRIAMRSDKTDQSFAAMIYAGAAILNSR